MHAYSILRIYELHSIPTKYVYRRMWSCSQTADSSCNLIRMSAMESAHYCCWSNWHTASNCLTYDSTHYLARWQECFVDLFVADNDLSILLEQSSQLVFSLLPRIHYRLRYFRFCWVFLDAFRRNWCGRCRFNNRLEITRRISNS